MLREPEGLWTAISLNTFTKHDNIKPLWLRNSAAYRLGVNNRLLFFLRVFGTNYYFLILDEIFLVYLINFNVYV